jgi:hypothetical protein
MDLYSHSVWDVPSNQLDVYTSYSCAYVKRATPCDDKPQIADPHADAFSHPHRDSRDHGGAPHPERNLFRSSSAGSRGETAAASQGGWRARRAAEHAEGGGGGGAGGTSFGTPARGGRGGGWNEPSTPQRGAAPEGNRRPSAKDGEGGAMPPAFSKHGSPGTSPRNMAAPQFANAIGNSNQQAPPSGGPANAWR